MLALQTIKINGFSGSVFSLLFYGVLFSIALYLIIYNLIKKFKENSRKMKLEKQLREQVGNRMLCIKCSYCKKRFYKPFRTSYHLSTYVPIYCRRFKKPLPLGTALLVCQADDPLKAMREKKQ